MRSIQLYATASATGNAAAQVTIPTSGRIKAIASAVSVDSITDNAVVTLELSKASTGQINVNGALDPFHTLRLNNNLLTSGMGPNVSNGFQPVDVPVRQGEIVYLHAVVSGTATYAASFIIWYD